MKICLIGSTRYIDRFNELNAKLTLLGHVVYSVATVTSSAGEELDEDSKETLDLVHLRKIAESEIVVVIGFREGDEYYIGKSTRREIKWATMLGKQVHPEKTIQTWDGRIVPIEDPSGVWIHPGWSGHFEMLKDCGKMPAEEDEE